MTVETVLLVLTTLTALVAVVVAVVAVRAVGRLSAQVAAQPVVEVAAPAALETTMSTRGFEADFAGTSTTDFLPAELEPRVVRGRVVVPPTQAQVVRAALGRPGVRLSLLAHGLARALRAENRDRIVALMRREYRHRRSERLRAGRQAVRTARPTSAPSTERLHEQLGESKPLSLTDRMIRS
jgi:hypothetical protein